MSEWCKKFLDRWKKKTISKDEYDKRFSKLYKFAKRQFPKDGHYQTIWLVKVFEKLDSLWYDNKLVDETIYYFGKFGIRACTEETKAGGYVEPFEDKLCLVLNRSLFKKLFQKGETGFHAGGCICNDRVHCLLNVLLHESLHVFLSICEKSDLVQENQYHGKLFKKLLYNLFLQKDTRHGLIPGLQKEYTLEKEKELLKKRVGQRVKLFQPSNHKHVTVTLEKVMTKFAWVKLKNDRLKVHIGLLKAN